MIDNFSNQNFNNYLWLYIFFDDLFILNLGSQFRKQNTNLHNEANHLSIAILSKKDDNIQNLLPILK